jgi:hypothetical protein
MPSESPTAKTWLIAGAGRGMGVDAHRDLSTGLAHDDAQVAA